MSDLQCALTVLVLPAGADVDVGAVRRERPARLFDAAGNATELATALEVPVQEVADDGAPSAVGHVTGLLADLADEYRGECVVLVVPAELFAELSGQVLPAGSAPTGAVVRVDADGNRWASWPSAAPE